MREKAKMTQPQVAGYLGITYQSYQKLENGRVAFRASVLEKLRSLFGVNYADLFGEREDTWQYPPAVTKTLAAIRDMDEDGQRRVFEQILAIKHKG